MTSSGGSSAMIGAVFGGRWKIEAPLSSGGMGAVYVATHADTGRRVALKVIRDDGAGNAELAARFRKETALLAAISHPNVVTFLDSGVDADRGTFFLVMELLPGRPLRSVMGAPLAWRRAFRIAADVCRALSAVHKGGIVHRDLKPENIFLQDAEGHDEIAKLIDFGIARLHDSTTAQTMTRTGAVVGTPGYIAPEQLQGQPASPASDVYAVGVILYELVTGTFPFEAPTPHAMLVKQLMEPLKPPRTALSTVPAHVEHVILRMMARDPAARIATAKDALATLVEALAANDSLPPTASTETENDLGATAARLVAAAPSSTLPTEAGGLSPPPSPPTASPTASSAPPTSSPSTPPTSTPSTPTSSTAPPTSSSTPPTSTPSTPPSASPAPAPLSAYAAVASAASAAAAVATQAVENVANDIKAGLNDATRPTAPTGIVVPPIVGVAPVVGPPVVARPEKRKRSPIEKAAWIIGICSVLCVAKCANCVRDLADRSDDRSNAEDGERGSSSSSSFHVQITPNDAGDDRAVDVDIGKHGVHVSPGRVKVGDAVDVQPGKVHVDVPGIPNIDVRDGIPSSGDMAKLIDAAMKEADDGHAHAHAVGKRPSPIDVKKLVQAHAKELRSCGPTKTTTTVIVSLSPEGTIGFDLPDDVDPTSLSPAAVAALSCAEQHMQAWSGPLFDGDDEVEVTMPLVLGGAR